MKREQRLGSVVVFLCEQGTLAQIASHERWLRCLAACERLDAEMDDPDGVKHREATRFIAVSQFASGAWLDLCPDGRHSSKITSEVFATATAPPRLLHFQRQVRVRRQGGGW